MEKIIIAIDGGAGTGKRSVAKYISNKYNFYHLDSGVLYRRLASKIIKKEIDINNINKIKQFVKSLDYLSSKYHPSLRTESISKASSKIATYSFVSKFINLNQKKIVKKKLKFNKGCVIDGRDIGSKVFKQAKIKLFIRVNEEIRAKRRHKQLIELGEKSIYPKILKEIKLRDKLDKNRKHSPLVKSRGAIDIDNSANFKKTLIDINKIIKKII